jgi:transcriptional regulator with XRE-family HTH domain
MKKEAPTVPTAIWAIGEFGAKLYDLRTKRRLSQRELARRAGLCVSYVSALENGRRLPPLPAVTTKLLKALEAPPQIHAELSLLADHERRPTIPSLPIEVEALILHLRLHGNSVPIGLACALHQKLREAVP